MGKSKNINPDVKVLLFDLFKYFDEISNEKQPPITPNETKSSLVSRICLISKFSKAAIFSIIHKGEKNELLVSKPRKQRKSWKDELNHDDLNHIRGMIYNFHETEKCLITLKGLSQKIEVELGMKFGTGTVRKIVNILGFKFRKSKNNRLQLIESESIKMKRNIYLQQINKYREEGRPIIYTDETYVHTNYSTAKSWEDGTREGFHPKISKGSRFIVVHAGGEGGFINNALLCFKSGSNKEDYHGDMNLENFTRWSENQLIPNLPPNSIVVLDNAPYHNAYDNPPPNSNARKDVIMNWMVAKV